MKKQQKEELVQVKSIEPKDCGKVVCTNKDNGEYESNVAHNKTTCYRLPFDKGMTEQSQDDVAQK